MSTAWTAPMLARIFVGMAASTTLHLHSPVTIGNSDATSAAPSGQTCGYLN